MLQAEPMAPPITEELCTINHRLVCLRENFDTLANDFGIHLDQPEMPSVVDGANGPGLDALRLEVTRINTQIALIEQLYDRLFAARAQLFGVGEGQWQTTNKDDAPIPRNYPPIQAGDFRAH